MRFSTFVLVGTLAAGFSGTAMAQSNASSQTTPTVAPANNAGYTRSHWIASGFVGGNFNARSDSQVVDNNSGNSIDFGGETAYLWRGVVGGEFLMDFAPSTFAVNDRFLLADKPAVNSYMANAIAAIPLGVDGRFQPYVSGGLGGIHLATSITNPVTATTSSNHEMLGGTNIGGGAMVFASPNWGVRGDVRYFHTSTVNDLGSGTPADQLTKALLSGLTFWRANAGITFRW